MRDQRQIALLYLAPSTSVAITEFDKINGPFKLVLPLFLNYAALITIYHHERSGAQKWKHRVVLKAHQAADVLAGIEVHQKGCWNFAPDGYGAIQELCRFPAESRVQPYRNRHGSVQTADVSRNGLGQP